MDEQAFSQWLKDNLSYIDKSARDVRSRVKRASKFIDLTKNVTDDELVFSLSQHPEFKSMSMTVKSQIKRGVKLYRQFLQESK